MTRSRIGRKTSFCKDREQKLKRNRTTREIAKCLNIKVDEKEGQERIDILTGKRMSNEN
jgi:hypothetical protein